MRLAGPAYPGCVPLLRYSLLRLALLLAVFAVLWICGIRGWLWLILGVVIAGAISYLAFPRQRDAAAGVLAERAEHRRGAQDVDADSEDAVLEAAVDAEGVARSDDDDAAAGSGAAAADGPVAGESEPGISAQPER